MKATNLIPTSEKVEISDYPYGFRLRTTLFDTIEFDKKKGYRHVTQTIDPKNGNLNKPKKSTYHPLLVRYYDENNHIKTHCFDFTYSENNINKCSNFIAENFDLFTHEEIKYFYEQLFIGSYINARGLVTYCNADATKVLEVFKPFNEIIKQGKQDGLNHFNELVLDVDLIESLKDPNYNPFTIKSV